MTQTIKTTAKSGSTLETDLPDSYVKKVYEMGIPVESPTEPEKYSRSIMAAYHRAKKASLKNDLRSQKIVDALRIERCDKRVPEKKASENTCEQKSLMDF